MSARTFHARTSGKAFSFVKVHLRVVEKKREVLTHSKPKQLTTSNHLRAEPCNRCLSDQSYYTLQLKLVLVACGSKSEEKNTTSHMVLKETSWQKLCALKRICFSYLADYSGLHNSATPVTGHVSWLLIEYSQSRNGFNCYSNSAGWTKSLLRAWKTEILYCSGVSTWHSL